MAVESSLIVAKFEGGLAADHRLPAYQATESMFGIARAITISSNYLFEGRVRRRRFEKTQFRLDLVTQRPGSFESVFQLLFDPSLLVVLGVAGLPGAVSAPFIVDFIKATMQRAMGGRDVTSIEQLLGDRKLSEGDVSALAEALEPALKQAHKAVGFGAQSINIQTGDHSPVVLDQSTKNYLLTSITSGEVFTKAFSVGSLNANTGYGRVFDFEEGRTIPFQLPSKLDTQSLNALLQSFNNYSYDKLGGFESESRVYIQYTRTEAVDGKVKIIHPTKARPTLEELR